MVGFYKVGSGKPSISWGESVDEALCFGWIDGVRKSIDKESYTIRFTPRKPTSIWSAINVQKMEALTAKGLMQPAGHAAFGKRTESKSRVYAYEKKPAELDAASVKNLKANKKANAFFRAQAPSYQNTLVHWVMSAKQEITKNNRLEKLITESAPGRKLR